MAREPIEHFSPRALEIVATLARERDALEARIDGVVARLGKIAPHTVILDVDPLEAAIAAVACAVSAYRDEVADLRRDLEGTLPSSGARKRCDVLDARLARVRDAWAGMNVKVSSVADFDRHNATLDALLGVDTSNGGPLSLGETFAALEADAAKLITVARERDAAVSGFDRLSRAVRAYDAAIRQRAADGDFVKITGAGGAIAQGLDLDQLYACMVDNLDIIGVVETVDALRRERDTARKGYDEACNLVGRMHAAAMGEVRGPVLGVVEDVEALRTKCERAILAKEAAAAVHADVLADVKAKAAARIAELEGANDKHRSDGPAVWGPFPSPATSPPNNVDGAANVYPLGRGAAGVVCTARNGGRICGRPAEVMAARLVGADRDRPGAREPTCWPCVDVARALVAASPPATRDPWEHNPGARPMPHPGTDPDVDDLRARLARAVARIEGVERP